MNSTAADLHRAISGLAHAGKILSEAARRFPDQVAVAEAPRRPGRGRQSYAQRTFRELEERAESIARGLGARGIPPHTRLALMVPPGIDFVTLVFALFKAGMVSILIDPGMGKRNLIRCLSEADPQGLIGIRRAQRARWLFARRLPNCRLNWVIGRAAWGAAPLDELVAPRSAGPLPSPAGSPQLDSPAAIIFTTGSTGPPKGVLYRHRQFVHQAIEIGGYFQLPPGGVDLSGFPLFALFNAAMGVTTVFPRMDFTRPAAAEPRKLIASIRDWNATQSFGSPALWNTMASYCLPRGIRLDSVRQVLSAGAPVPSHVLQRVRAIIAEGGEIHTPYGATEALPVACITASEVLSETAAATAEGAGTCVGRRFPHIQWRVIALSDRPIPTMAGATPLPAGEIGELIVQGPVVTERYVTRPAANADHKIADGDRFWHRMGDVGYLDALDRFWFCGRKSHRVVTRDRTLFTIPCEAIFNQHPAIYRSALVGVGKQGAQRPVIVVQPWPEHWPRGRRARSRLLDELQARGRSHAGTRSIEDILIRRDFPVDIRHNAKIFREQLTVWAARHFRGGSSASNRARR